MCQYYLRVLKSIIFKDDFIIKNMNINDENLESLKRIIITPNYPPCNILRSSDMKIVFRNYNIMAKNFNVYS